MNFRPIILPDKAALHMFDLIYIATGAAFLYVCVLYAFACDQL